MKVEPKELINIVADAATELVNEHSEFSEQILMVYKMMLERINKKLFLLDVSDLGLSDEEIATIWSMSTGKKDSE